MNTTLHVCPRCEAYVQPDWPSCKICGYDPRHADQYADGFSITTRKRKKERMGVFQVLGAFATLVVLVVVVVAAGYGAVYVWNHRDPHGRQEFVSFEK